MPNLLLQMLMIIKINPHEKDLLKNSSVKNFQGVFLDK